MFQVFLVLGCFRFFGFGVFMQTDSSGFCIRASGVARQLLELFVRHLNVLTHNGVGPDAHHHQLTVSAFTHNFRWACCRSRSLGGLPGHIREVPREQVFSWLLRAILTAASAARPMLGQKPCRPVPPVPREDQAIKHQQAKVARFLRQGLLSSFAFSCCPGPADVKVYCK